MKKFRLASSLLVITLALLVGVVATQAYFSDTETSTLNEFTAGEIDLQLANTTTLYSDDNFDGAYEETTTANWGMKDLVAGTDIFFQFTDYKPGDLTISTHELDVDSNNAWACMAYSVLTSAENVPNEAEQESGDDTTDTAFSGELDSFLEYYFWNDIDGDGEYDGGSENVLANGNVSDWGGGDITAALDQVYALVDNDDDLWGDGYMNPASSYNLGMAFCLGDLTTNPGAGINMTGFNCNPTPVAVPSINVSQTDDVTATMRYYTIQTRNNSTFDCETGWDPTP